MLRFLDAITLMPVIYAESDVFAVGADCRQRHADMMILRHALLPRHDDTPF